MKSYSGLKLFFIAALLSVTVFSRQAFAMIPDLKPIVFNAVSYDDVQGDWAAEGISNMTVISGSSGLLDSHIAEELLGGGGFVGELDGGGSSEELGHNIDRTIESLQDDLLAPSEAKLNADKSHRKLYIAGGLLLSVSLIAALFAFFSGAHNGGGSGGSGGSFGNGGSGGPGGSGGAGNPGNFPQPNGPSGFGGQGGQGGSFWGLPGAGAFGKGVDPNGGNGAHIQLFIARQNLPSPGTVPHNPEPATFLLMLLGLGMPILRKKK